MKNFEMVGSFNFDPELVKGWYVEEMLGGIDDGEIVRRCVVLYDCFQLSLEDNEGELERWLIERKESMPDYRKRFRMPQR